MAAIPNAYIYTAITLILRKWNTIYIQLVGIDKSTGEQVFKCFALYCYHDHILHNISTTCRWLIDLVVVDDDDCDLNLNDT